MESKEKIKDKKQYWLAGVLGGFTATTCCIAPIVLILMGAGTALSMAVMHQFHLVSIVSGIILMILVSLYLVKRKSGVCNVKSMKENWKSVTIAFVIMVVSWFILNGVVVGTVAAKVYGDLDVNQKPLGNLAEMAESHGMPEMANVEVVPEMEGKKLINLEVQGVFCGSCGPAIQYDVKSISGVLEVVTEGRIMSVTYDSDVTSKDVIIASIHSPYSAKLVSEEVIDDEVYE